MGLLHFNYRSETMGYYINVMVAYPTDRLTTSSDPEKLIHHSHDGTSYPLFTYKPNMKFQTIYLIHGGGDDATLTYRYTNVERFAQEHQVMLVSPDIPNSLGVDTSYGWKYQTWISKELPQVIQTLFASSPKREDNFIVGYAMGGNIALGTALLHPENYAECVDISGGIGYTLDHEKLMDEIKNNKIRMGHFRDIWGDPDTVTNLYEVTKKNLEDGVALPKFHILCGADEYVRPRIEGDVRKAEELGLDYEFVPEEGFAHNFEYWGFIMERFYDVLTLKNAPIYEEEDA